MKFISNQRLYAHGNFRFCKKALFLVSLFVCYAVSVFSLSAQVTIGETTNPNKYAVLELKSPSGNKLGFLPPRVPITSFSDDTSFGATVTEPLPEGLIVVNNSTGSSEPSKGVYIWTGARWQAMENNWFYMPPTVFDTDASDPTAVKTKDLWQVYADQFTSTVVAKNANAPSINTKIPPHSNRQDFYYYVTACDVTVFTDINITDNGEMTYKVGAAAGDSTYINIVFVRKQY